MPCYAQVNTAVQRDWHRHTSRVASIIYRIGWRHHNMSQTTSYACACTDVQRLRSCRHSYLIILFIDLEYGHIDSVNNFCVYVLSPSGFSATVSVRLFSSFYSIRRSHFFPFWHANIKFTFSNEYGNSKKNCWSIQRNWYEIVNINLWKELLGK